MSNTERTLVLIKPDSIEKRLTGLIIDRLEHLGLQLTAAKVVVPTEELIRAHYSHLAGKPFLEGVVTYMLGNLNPQANHKIYAFVFQGEDAIARVRREIGNTNPDKADPWTIRGSFGKYIEKDDIVFNCVHASGDVADAEREIALWFSPQEITAQ